MALNTLTASKLKMLQMLLHEKAYRLMQGLALYKPLPHQLAFHTSQAAERIAFGSNRGGKTTATCAEVAMAVTGRHPYIDYPKENGRCICVAKDGIKIGEVMFRKLFQRGAYRLVFDQTTGYWRRWEPRIDKETFRETKPSLPLIPREMVRKIAWEQKAKNWPKIVYLHNGWEILFFTSAGKPIEGVDIDLCLFDEEIYEGAWYTEMAARLIDRNGRFIWSATPDLSTDQFEELYQESQKLLGTPMPRIESFFMDIDLNEYLRKEQVDTFKAKLANNPEKYKVKVLGQFLNSSQRVYPTFNIVSHGCESFTVPKEWTRYLVIDPGFANCVALFFAVPPPSDTAHAPHTYLYDELYGHSIDCNEFARQLEMKLRGQSIEAFLIDEHGSRRTESSGKTIGQQFSEAFEKHHIKSISTGSNFVEIGEAGYEGHSSVVAGVQDVRSWLWNQDNGKPVLQVFHVLCSQFVDEMKRYKNIVNKRTQKPTDKPDQTKHSHGPDCLRYAKMHHSNGGLVYVEPRIRAKGPSAIMKYYRNKLKKLRKQNGSSKVSM